MKWKYIRFLRKHNIIFYTKYTGESCSHQFYINNQTYIIMCNRLGRKVRIYHVGDYLGGKCAVYSEYYPPHTERIIAMTTCLLEYFRNKF